MTQIASEDYDNLLIYLHVDTVTNGFDPALMQQEHRTLRRLNANDERGYDIMVTFTGLEAIGGGKFTPGLTRLRTGVRIVPYDTGTGMSYNLDILNQIVNVDDAIADRDVFDRSSVDATVNIDSTYSPVEVIQINTGSGLTAAQDQKLTDVEAKTSQIVFTVANQVDSNVQSVNEEDITGTGQPGDEFGTAP